MYLAPIAVAVAIAFFHVLGEELSEHIERFHIELLSFGAGLMVGTFFLEILPQITVGETYLSHFIYVTFLVGFVLIHVLEKLVYQHAAGESEFDKDVTRFEAAGLVAYGLLVGVVITVFFETYCDLAYVILAPFFVRAFALSVYSKHINEKIGSRLNRLLQSAGPIVGTFAGLTLIANKTQLFLVFSPTMGLVLYIVIRDMIPIGKEGKPIYFLAGALITIATALIFHST
jgi:ZIP family zinc transporter